MRTVPNGIRSSLGRPLYTASRDGGRREDGQGLRSRSASRRRGGRTACAAAEADDRNGRRRLAYAPAWALAPAQPWQRGTNSERVLARPSGCSGTCARSLCTRTGAETPRRRRLEATRTATSVSSPGCCQPPGTLILQQLLFVVAFFVVLLVLRCLHSPSTCSATFTAGCGPRPPASQALSAAVDRSMRGRTVVELSEFGKETQPCARSTHDKAAQRDRFQRRRHQRRRATAGRDKRRSAGLGGAVPLGAIRNHAVRHRAEYLVGAYVYSACLS